MARSNKDTEPMQGRYEFRVWGKHKRAREILVEIADDSSRERIEDCYLLTDDTEWNAKVRDDTLKVKQLITERKGFEQWTSERHRTAKSTPSPFDVLFQELRLDRPQRGKSYDLEKAVAKIDPSLGVHAVFVNKERQRFVVGDLRAEVTDITIAETGDVLTTLSIEGDDLPTLVALRKRLGLKGEKNVAVHQVIGEEKA